MPYKSDKQRRYLHAKHPEVAAKWDAEIRAKRKVSKSKQRTLHQMIDHGIDAAQAALDTTNNQRKAKKRVKKNFEPVWIHKRSGDPYFNEAVAEKVFDLVRKMDDDEAEMFAYFVGCEMLDQDIQKNLRTLQRHLDDVVSKRLARVKNAVYSVAKRDGVDEDAVAFAGALMRLEEITKAKDPDKKKKRVAPAHDPKAYSYFEESSVRRNQLGQFATEVKVNRNAPAFSNKQMEAMGHSDAVERTKALSLSDKDKSQFQQEYLQLANFLGTFTDSGGDAGDSVVLHLKNKSTGAVYQVPSAKGTKPPADAWNPKKERLIAVDAKPSQLKMGGASYNLAQGLGAGPTVSGDAARYGDALDANLGPLSVNWTEPVSNDAMSTNARTYSRVETGSKFVGAVARPGSAVHTAARLAQFAGEHGPEAEKVFGPAARTTAYRYRGTEKQPDPHIVELYDRAIRYTKLNAPVVGPDVDRRPIPGEPPTAFQQAASRAEAINRVPTWAERDAGRGVIMQQLGFNIPSRQLFGLQLASGHTPPSEGILLNRDGQIVTQAVGYGDDHYLPFNLKNLKALKGGEYIRTRSVGGPTSEDIYTGLLAGARQVTVISRSGTFTVKFDETLRGGRRYNDKAMRMTDRYEHLLDALESEQVDAKPVPEHIRAAIQDEIDRDYGSWSPAEQKKMFEEKQEEYKSYGSGLTKEDRAYIDARVEVEQQRDPSRPPQEVKQALTQDAMADKEFKFRLNGEGYKAALQALQEQFPYYITSSATPFREPDLPEPERDKGYVMPRHNRPGAAKAGYFNTRIQGQGQLNYLSGPLTGQASGKISAADADYQNYAYAGSGLRNPGKTPEEVAAAIKENGAVAGARTGAVSVDQGGTSEQKALREKKEVLADRRDANSFSDTAWDLIKAAPPPVEWTRRAGNRGAQLVAQDDRTGFDELVSTEAGRAEVTQMIKSESGSKGNFRKARKQWGAFVLASSQVDRKVMNDASAFNWQDKPMKAPGDAFKKTADPGLASRVLDDLNGRSRAITSDKKYAEMTDEEKQAEIKALKQLHADREMLKGTAAEQREAFNEFGVMNPKNGAFLVNNKDPEAIRKQALILHKVRLIQFNQARRAAKEGGAAAEALLARLDAAPREAAEGTDHDPEKVAAGLAAEAEDEAGGRISHTGAHDLVAPEERRKALNDYLSVVARHMRDANAARTQEGDAAYTILNLQNDEIRAALSRMSSNPSAVAPAKVDELIRAAQEMTDEKDWAKVSEMPVIPLDEE